MCGAYRGSDGDDDDHYRTSMMLNAMLSPDGPLHECQRRCVMPTLLCTLGGLEGGGGDTSDHVGIEAVGTQMTMIPAGGDDFCAMLFRAPRFCDYGGDNIEGLDDGD